MIAVRIFAAVAFGVVLAATPARAAVSVTLECVLIGANGQPAPYLHWHQLLDIDYDAQTVREYRVDDDDVILTVGGQLADMTIPVQIGEKEITWQVRDVSQTLGRYSGIWTATSATFVMRLQCQPWTPSNQQRKF